MHKIFTSGDGLLTSPFVLRIGPPGNTDCPDEAPRKKITSGNNKSSDFKYNFRNVGFTESPTKTLAITDLRKLHSVSVN